MSITNILEGINCNTGSIKTLDEYDLGTAELSDSGQAKDSPRERTTGADYITRKITFKLYFKATTAALRDSLYSSVKAKLTRGGMGVLEFNTGGWPVNRYYDFYKGKSSMSTIIKTYENETFSRIATVSLECLPFARSTAFNLPQNYVIDSTLSEDWDGDGIPNSFVADDSGTPPTGTVTVKDGYTEIQVTGGGSTGRYKGIKQTLTIPAGSKYGQVEAYVANQTGTATALIFTDNWDASQIVLNANQDWTVIPGGNDGGYGWETGAANPVIHIQVLAPSSGDAMILRVRNLLVTDTAIDGTAYEGMFWTSESSGSPASMRVTGVPGDVPADCLMRQLQPDGVARTMQFISGQAGPNYRPLSDVSNNKGGYIYKWNGTASTYALGGECSAVQAHASELVIDLGTMLGKFLVFARMKVSANTTGTPTVHLNLHGAPKQSGSPYETTALAPFTAVNKWFLIPLGMLDVPLSAPTDWGDWVTGAHPASSLGIQTEGGAGDGWQIDHLTFLPVYSYVRCNTFLTAGQHGLIVDTISHMQNLQAEYAPASSNITVGTGGYGWYWASYADYLAKYISVDMADLEPGGVFSSISDSVTYVSESGATRVFDVGGSWDGAFTATFTPSLPFHLTASATKGGLPSEGIPDGFWLDTSDNDFIIMSNDYVNSSTQSFNTGGSVVSWRVMPRYLD